MMHVRLSALIAAALISCAGLEASAATITGRVVKVAVGDTITVPDDQLQQHKIRLAGVDAPEKAQDFGNRSRLIIAAMVAGKNFARAKNACDPKTPWDVDQKSSELGQATPGGSDRVPEVDG